ncbi:DUF1934 domain-containing protein [Alkalicoccus chagannorensis]|uniref:DUF1934 domain-containing protein n=1 Tax=Alkalicoccus chagannorensis TaxID=427072 RepID=UPI0004191EC3|nr:DUF1934 domain-containing protein [Alkalicoccus chagannorensis]
MTQNKMDVDISIQTTIRDGGQRERHTMETNGELIWRGGLLALQFDEPVEEGEPQGTSQVMQLRDGRLSVKRKGAVQMDQRFVEGEKTRGMFTSQAGPMQMETDTKELQYDWDDMQSRGTILLVYVLRLAGQKTGTYTMKVTFEEGSDV